MFLWLLTFYQTGPNGLFIFYQVFNLILQSAVFMFINPETRISVGVGAGVLVLASLVYMLKHRNKK